MKRADFEFDDDGGRAEDVAGMAGTPEGDGDFETDNLPSTGETSGGGQVSPTENTRDGVQGSEQAGDAGGGRKVIDEISTGKIQP